MNDRNSDSCYVPENMKLHISKQVKICDRCQKSKKHKLRYGHIPLKVATIHLQKQVSVDLIGLYTVQAKGGTKLTLCA